MEKSLLHVIISEAEAAKEPGRGFLNTDTTVYVSPFLFQAILDEKQLILDSPNRSFTYYHGNKYVFKQKKNMRGYTFVTGAEEDMYKLIKKLELNSNY